MDEISKAARTAVLECIRPLARASLQVEYDPGELVSMFCDDLFHPKSQAFLDAFTEDEIRDLAELYGMLCAASRKMSDSYPDRVTDLQKLPEWRMVMTCAKELEVTFGISGR